MPLPRNPLFPRMIRCNASVCTTTHTTWNTTRTMYLVCSIAYSWYGTLMHVCTCMHVHVYDVRTMQGIPSCRECSTIPYQEDILASLHRVQLSTQRCVMLPAQHRASVRWSRYPRYPSYSWVSYHYTVCTRCAVRMHTTYTLYGCITHAKRVTLMG